MCRLGVWVRVILPSVHLWGVHHKVLAWVRVRVRVWARIRFRVIPPFVRLLDVPPRARARARASARARARALVRARARA